MKLKKKHLIIGFLSVLLVFFITAGIIFKKSSNEKIMVSEPVNQEKSVEKEIKKEIPVKSTKKKVFTTNAEIKKEYGKLEKVYLLNGKIYTGAVLNTDEIYTIVTVDGTFKIPMKEVKIREIIR